MLYTEMLRKVRRLERMLTRKCMIHTSPLREDPLPPTLDTKHF